MLRDFLNYMQISAVVDSEIFPGSIDKVDVSIPPASVSEQEKIDKAYHVVCKLAFTPHKSGQAVSDDDLFTCTKEALGILKASGIDILGLEIDRPLENLVNENERKALLYGDKPFSREQSRYRGIMIGPNYRSVHIDVKVPASQAALLEEPAKRFNEMISNYQIQDKEMYPGV